MHETSAVVLHCHLPKTKKLVKNKKAKYKQKCKVFLMFKSF